MEDIDWHHPRGLDRALVRNLANSDWVRQHHHLLISGPNVQHYLLLQKVARRIQDAMVMRLLNLIPKSTEKKGVPQGGVINRLTQKVIYKRSQPLPMPWVWSVSLKLLARRPLFQSFKGHALPRTVVGVPRIIQ